MTLVGFKRMTIRVLDGEDTPTLGKNLFVVEGKTGEGATQVAKITGLSNEPVKTYGSDMTYHVASRGVGDVKVETTAVDIPIVVENAIIGYKVVDDLIYDGSSTEAPYCALLLESSTPAGDAAYLGFFKGKFSLDNLEIETLKEKQEELKGDVLTFSASASDDEETRGDVMVKYFGKEETKINKAKGQLKMVARG
ncbi:MULTISPECIES: major tail protein [unclassified Streptococcus]|uniref:major tail protein n=1 Tax=unclassified Streptococcus TaxID=2608887 RepID=UPI00211AF39C|nr:MULTISPECIES: major tail protein [unclassified Streptococcus]MCQ9212849.1 phage tail protein [Streptococcus sp. B01]MCQ9215016.1 phage tail protein [Streptococcus sp. O1]